MCRFLAPAYSSYIKVRSNVWTYSRVEFPLLLQSYVRAHMSCKPESRQEMLTIYYYIVLCILQSESISTFVLYF